MTTGSLSQYAAHINASPAYVTKLKRQGRLVMRDDSGRPVVDFELSDRLIRNTTDMARARNGANAGGDRGASAPVAPVADGGSRVDAVFRQAQAQEKLYAAKSAELAYRKACGELVEKRRVDTAVFEIFRLLRDRAMSNGAGLAAKLVGQTDMAIIEREYHAAIRAAFGDEAGVRQAMNAKGLQP